MDTDIRDVLPRVDVTLCSTRGRIIKYIGSLDSGSLCFRALSPRVTPGAWKFRGLISYPSCAAILIGTKCFWDSRGLVDKIQVLLRGVVCERMGHLMDGLASRTSHKEFFLDSGVVDWANGDVYEWIEAVMLGAGGVSICALEWTFSEIPLMGLYISCFLSLWCVGSFCYMVLTPLLARSFSGMYPWVGVLACNNWYDILSRHFFYWWSIHSSLSCASCVSLSGFEIN